MRPERASWTAKLVAATRGLGVFLPPGLCSLAPDPFGLAMAYPSLVAALHRWPRVAAWSLSSGPFYRFTLGMALRTRFIDDALRRFVASGGRQVLLLGAGLDARPWRLREELPHDVRWLAVDHPATQAATRKALAAALAPLRVKPGDSLAEVRWVAHDFEQPMAALRAKLLEAGLDTTSRVLVIWEGVVMYLTEQALEASVELIRSVSCPGSVLCLNYIPPECLRAPLWPQSAACAPKPASNLRRLLSWLLWPWRMLACIFSAQFWIYLLLRLCGEPLMFAGWPRGQLPSWLAARGFSLQADRSHADLADAMGAPPATSALLGEAQGIVEHFVEARRTADANGPRA